MGMATDDYVIVDYPDSNLDKLIGLEQAFQACNNRMIDALKEIQRLNEILAKTPVLKPEGFQAIFIEGFRNEEAKKIIAEDRQNSEKTFKLLLQQHECFAAVDKAGKEAQEILRQIKAAIERPPANYCLDAYFR